MCLSSWKSGTTEKEYIHTSGTKHPNNMGKSIIQNALNYLSSFLLQVHISLLYNTRPCDQICQNIDICKAIDGKLPNVLKIE
jgi:hypothetical protein